MPKDQKIRGLVLNAQPGFFWPTVCRGFEYPHAGVYQPTNEDDRSSQGRQAQGVKARSELMALSVLFFTGEQLPQALPEVSVDRSLGQRQR